MEKISVSVIGTIETPHLAPENMPIQPSGATGIQGRIVLEPELVEGLKDIEGFSHLILLYRFHKLDTHQLLVKPFMDDKKHGIFATRSPKRPSLIGMSTVKLLEVKGNVIVFEGADMLNGTPLLDIKPFFRQTDNRPDAVSGWLDEKAENLAEVTLSDKRFAK